MSTKDVKIVLQTFDLIDLQVKYHKWLTIILSDSDTPG